VNNPKLKNPFPPPPSYYADNLVNLAEGKMYHSVHYGKNLMGPYSKVLDHDQIWKVVYYVKSLQQDYINSQPKTETAVASADTTKKQ
jgi:mono/diheme cytochrome c family protein